MVECCIKCLKYKGHSSTEETRGTFTIVYRGLERKSGTKGTGSVQTCWMALREQSPHMKDTFSETFTIRTFEPWTKKRFFAFMELPRSSLRKELDSAQGHRTPEYQAKTRTWKHFDTITSCHGHWLRLCHGHWLWSYHGHWLGSCETATTNRSEQNRHRELLKSSGSNPTLLSRRIWNTEWIRAFSSSRTRKEQVNSQDVVSNNQLPKLPVICHLVSFLTRFQGKERVPKIKRSY